MTLDTFYKLLQVEISKTGYIKEWVREDIYKLNGDPDTNYAVSGYSTQTVDYNNDWVTLTFQLYFIDRLTDTRSNYASIISTGVETLNHVLQQLEYTSNNIVVGNKSYQPVNADFGFKDICAAIVGTITVQFPANQSCEEDPSTPETLRIL